METKLIPRQNDVLFGKGTAINSHRGNKTLRSVVEARQPRFLQTKREEKREVAKDIVLEIQTSGGRFLMEDPSTRNNKKEKVRGNDNSNFGSNEISCTGAVGNQWGDDNGLATEPSILDKLWVLVEMEKAIDKVMHRLREKRKGSAVGRKKPPEISSSSAESSVQLQLKPADTAKQEKPSRLQSCEYSSKNTQSDSKKEKILPLFGKAQKMAGLHEGPDPQADVVTSQTQVQAPVMIGNFQIKLQPLVSRNDFITGGFAQDSSNNDLKKGGSRQDSSNILKIGGSRQDSSNSNMKMEGFHQFSPNSNMKMEGSRQDSSNILKMEGSRENSSNILQKEGSRQDSSNILKMGGSLQDSSNILKMEGSRENSSNILEKWGSRQDSSNILKMGGSCQDSLNDLSTGGFAQNSIQASAQATNLLPSQVTAESSLPTEELAATPLKPMSAKQQHNNLDTQTHAILPHYHGLSVPISMKYWMRSTLALSQNSTEVYLRDAVNLSWMLTNHLVELIAVAQITLPDISAEKVMIFADSPAMLPSSTSSGSLAIQGVQFQRSATPLLSTALHPPGMPLQPRAVCAALGNLLLELFSGGGGGQRHSAAGGEGEGTSKTCGGALTPSDRDHSGGHYVIVPPFQRRRVSSLMDTTADGGGASPISMMANGVLLKCGMPVSICRLVCDLLDSISEPCPDSALMSLEEVLWDLTQMKNDPEHYLFDRTCPQKALDETGLFHGIEGQRMFGREKELSTLMSAKKSIADHVRKMSGHGSSTDSCTGSASSQRNILSFGQEIDFKCEMMFLSGYAGSGKSTLLNSLISACNDDGWFVLGCKFDKKVAPIKVLANAFDNLFARWAPSNNSKHCSNNNNNNNCNGGPRSHAHPAMVESFAQVCRSISSTVDKEGLIQFCELIPNMRNIFPDVVIASVAKGHNWDHGTSSSIGQVGSAEKRRLNFFHVLFKSLCSVGRPVLLTYDDIQWADSMEGIKDLIINYANVPCAIQKGACIHGLMTVWAFRSNEVRDNDSIIKTISTIEQNKSAKVTGLAIGELEHGDITKLLSSMLYLPFRHTNKLAALVLTKTRGNPFFIVQFLKTIVQNGKMLEFSVQSRRWDWDCDVIDMQMISNEVAELLTTRFNQLPDYLMWTLKITSCLGIQADGAIIDMLNVEQQVPFNMQDALLLAIKEGLVEKAGPIFQFTHDIILQTIYNTMPLGDRKLLHKTIGESLLKSDPTDNPTVYHIAVDQINIYCEDGTLTTQERSQFTKVNVTAAKFAIAASSFEQARSYIDAGMKMLDTNHWEKQYSLSLDLFEMSASVSCMHGDTLTLQSCLNQIIANVKSFEDSLTSSSLLSKLLAASSKYNEAIGNCLLVLSTLGEEFPKDITLQIILNELSVIQTTLSNITVEQVRLLPPMANSSKLNAMKFLSMICMYCIQSKPMLVPLLGCRMVRLTIEHGFCDDSIVGLVTAGYGLFSFTDDIQLGYQIGKVGEALIEESQNMHALRSRLCFELDSTLKAVVEPMQSAVSNCSDRYNSAMLAGDVDSAQLSLLAHCIGSLHIGMELSLLSKSFEACIKQSTKYKQNTALYLAMSSFGACIYLSGRTHDAVDVKTYGELNTIGVRMGHLNLLYQNFFNEMSCYFWMRDCINVVKLTEKNKPTKHKRILEVLRTFFEGIASITLARHTHQSKWKIMGEEALEKMIRWKKVSKWNFENMALLLQAELHYLNGDLDLADVAYKASIVSAHAHKFLHYEAFAYELHGIFCVESGMADRGFDQLKKALNKYKRWGAAKKVEDLQFTLDLINPTYLRRELRISIS